MYFIDFFLIEGSRASRPTCKCIPHRGEENQIISYHWNAFLKMWQNNFLILKSSKSRFKVTEPWIRRISSTCGIPDSTLILRSFSIHLKPFNIVVSSRNLNLLFKDSIKKKKKIELKIIWIGLRRYHKYYFSFF